MNINRAFFTKSIFKQVIINKNVHSNASLINNIEFINNRNPRNLELLRIAIKNDGYHLEKVRPTYWHKFTIIHTSKHTTFEIQHFENGTILQASTTEWPIKRRLYRCRDTAAYINLARVLAQRCLESGIMFVWPDPELPGSEKVQLALDKLQECGVTLSEPERYRKPHPWSVLWPEKPWEVLE